MPYSKEQAQEQFESWSTGYNESILQKLLFVPSHNCFLEQIAGSSPTRLLDVGCGTGKFAERVYHSHPDSEIWGLDFSGGMLRQSGPAASGRIKFVQGDSEAIPLASESFDIVTCANSFHHYPNQANAITEMFRVLRPGGRLLIIDGYRDGLWGRFIYDFCVVAVEGSVHHASARRFRELFWDAGFVGVRQQAKLGLAPFLLTQGIAEKESETASQPRRVAA